MKRIHAFAALATFALGAGAFGGPVTYDFSSTESLHGRASFTGSAVYDNTNDTLTFDITNTSKGALTAFAFEAPKGDAAKFVHPAGSSFKDDRNKKDIVNAAPYGKYEGGAAVNGRWGSTAAKKGLAAGQSETFVFDVTGSNASSLTTADFFNDTKAEIVAHFAGFKGHKQDKAGGFGHAVINTTTTTPTDTSVFTVNPPVVINPPGNTITPPGNGGNGVAAVPLPPAAPAGIAMLVILALGGGFKRLRAVFARA